VDERCDGIDNDCDESTDEGFALGGACKYDDERGIPQDGVTACDFASGGLTCIAGMDCSTDADGDGANICMDCDDDDRRSYPQAIELCDGADNDCDGRDDEIFDFESICYVGEGVCRRGGEPVCAANGELGCDATPGEPEGEERCGDAEDDDCDGQVDEGFEVGAACMAGIGACRVEGIIDCARDGVGVACDAVARAPEAELELQLAQLGPANVASIKKPGHGPGFEWPMAESRVRPSSGARIRPRDRSRAPECLTRPRAHGLRW
jgi:hypothetical protein